MSALVVGVVLHHRPGGSRHLVGHGEGYDHRRLAFGQKGEQPRAGLVGSALGRHDDRDGAAHEQAAQILVALLADPAEPDAFAGGSRAVDVGRPTISVESVKGIVRRVKRYVSDR